MALASKAGIIAGRAFVLIEALDMTAPALRSVERSILTLGSRLQSLSTQLFTRALTAAIPGAISTRLFQQYDDIMRRVEARSGGTAEEMQALRDQTRQLGMTSAFSARQVASLQDVLGQRKFNRKQIFQMTEPILKLARSAGEGNMEKDILDAADLLSQATLMFQTDTKDSMDIANTFTQAANESNFALEDLGISMATVGPIAKQMNLSLQETIAALMVMRDLGIDPSVAGTGLRNILLKASELKRTDQFNQTLHDLNGNMVEFADTAGNLHDIPDVLNSINKATAGLGSAHKARLLANLFGLRAITPAAALTNNIDAFQQAMTALMNRAGATEKAYEMMEGGIGGAFRRLWNNAEELGLKIGESLAPTITIYGNMLKVAQQNIGAWITTHREAVRVINLFIAALLPTAAALFTLGTALRLVAFGMHPLVVVWATFLSLLNVTGAILASAVVAGFIALARSIGLAFAGVMLIIRGLTVMASIFVSVFNSIRMTIFLFNRYINVLSLTGRTVIAVADQFVLLMQFAEEAAVLATRTVAYYLIPVLLRLGNTLQATFGIGIQVIDELLSMFLLFTATIVNMAAYFGTYLLGGIVGFASLLQQVFGSILTSIFAVISSLITSIVAAIPALIAGVVLWSAGLAIVSALSSAILAAMSAIYAQVVAIGTTIYTSFVGALSASTDKLLEFGRFAIQIGSSISKALMAGDTELAMNIGIAAMKVAWLDFSHFIQTTWKTVVDYIRSTFEELKRSFLMFIYNNGEMINAMNVFMHPNQRRVKDLIDMDALAQELFVNKPGNPAENERKRKEAEIAEKDRLEARQSAMDDLLDLLEKAKEIPDPMDQLKAMEAATAAAHAQLPPDLEDLSNTGFGGLTGGKHIDAAIQRTKEGAVAAYENSEASKDSLSVQQQQLVETKKANDKLDGIKKGIDKQNSKPQVAVNGV